MIVLRNEVLRKECAITVNKMPLLRLVLSILLSVSSFAAANYWVTTHSPLTAFKQLGFDEGNPHSPSYIPYSISDYHAESESTVSQRTNKQTSSSGLTQIRHPNDILSNMGVDIPSQEILGKTF